MRISQKSPLPLGVIEPFQWGDRPIPVSGSEGPYSRIVEDAILRAMREYGIVGCGVCVTLSNDIVYSGGFGYAELPNTPFLISTASRCGSLAKPLAGLCALILADQGKLDLDAPILPILRGIGVSPKLVGSETFDNRISQIRVRHLMDHTSGLPRSATYTAWRQDQNVVERLGLDAIATSADVCSDCLGSSRLDSEPGTAYQYANANFVLLGRIIEAASGRNYNQFLTEVAMPLFRVGPTEIYVSRNQLSSGDRARGTNEAAYYQTSSERYVSFVPVEQAKGQVYGEAYHGYSTECSDAAGGTACAALAFGKIIANLNSASRAISPQAMREIATPPEHYLQDSAFDPASSGYYSKGFNVTSSGDRLWLSHGGMTNHCGGVIGHNAGYQYVAVSNWNNVGQPYVDSILGRALSEAAARILDNPTPFR